LRERKKTACRAKLSRAGFPIFRKSSGRRLAQGPRDFSGSLDDKKTSRGVFVTTARFARGAEDYVRGIPKSIVLIDGCELTRLMVVHGVGVGHEPMIDARTVDEDYFRTLAAGC
jgi:restriction endonuclease Mrr